jgi:hypothetical protein
MKLVENVKSAWKWYSVQALGVLAVVPMVWVDLPADIKSHIPDEWMPYVVSVIALGGLVGRLKAQSK